MSNLLVSADLAHGKLDQTAVQVMEAYAPVQQLINGLIHRTPYLILALIAFVFFWVLARVYKYLVRKLLSQRAQKRQNLVMVLNRIGTTLILFVGFLVAMMIAVPGFTPGQLISALGIGSVAIGFAFKDIFQNLLSGILILLSEPFRIGDQIISGSFEGIVEDIQIRATYLRTYDGRRIVIPNSQLYTTAVTVNTAYERRRLSTDLTIGCNDDIDQAKAVILATLSQCDTVLKTAEPTVVVTNLGDYGTDLRVRWWVGGSAQVDVVASTDEVLAHLKTALATAGIDLPYPTQQVLFHDQTEEFDGNRALQREGWPSYPTQNPRSRAQLVHLMQVAPPTGQAMPVLTKRELARDPSEASYPERD